MRPRRMKPPGRPPSCGVGSVVRRKPPDAREASDSRRDAAVVERPRRAEGGEGECQYEDDDGDPHAFSTPRDARLFPQAVLEWTRRLAAIRELGLGRWGALCSNAFTTRAEGDAAAIHRASVSERAPDTRFGGTSGRASIVSRAPSPPSTPTSPTAALAGRANPIGVHSLPCGRFGRLGTNAHEDEGSEARPASGRGRPRP
jgi:hypothetical protein